MPEKNLLELKSRLEWGQPALTILDVRDRQAFNHGHIMGAMPIPLNELASKAKTCLNAHRDIYVYGGSDEETSRAAHVLKDAGFQHVSELLGGVSAWKTHGGPTEGIGA
ncbi:MAG: rhodanese-like domain-containing protein [Scytonematopsis contorta HA4267-MV1]|jgi:rhodanese-related sulfurtransferase|nr:rhodanese-like domain-containing protein [Scytonematopsis contorta HA4267-MV1]